MNLHPRRYNYDTVAFSGRKHKGNVRSCVGYQVCFGMRGVVWCKSRDVENVQDAGIVCNSGGLMNGGVGKKQGYIYSSSCDSLV